MVGAVETVHEARPVHREAAGEDVVELHQASLVGVGLHLFEPEALRHLPQRALAPGRPGVEVAGHDHRPRVSGDRPFDERHVLFEGAAETEVDRVDVHHQEVLFVPAEIVGGDERHLRCGEHRLEDRAAHRERAPARDQRPRRDAGGHVLVVEEARREEPLGGRVTRLREGLAGVLVEEELLDHEELEAFADGAHVGVPALLAALVDVPEQDLEVAVEGLAPGGSHLRQQLLVVRHPHAHPELSPEPAAPKAAVRLGVVELRAAHGEQALGLWRVALVAGDGPRELDASALGEMVRGAVADRCRGAVRGGHGAGGGEEHGGAEHRRRKREAKHGRRGQSKARTRRRMRRSRDNSDNEVANPLA